MLLRGRMPLDKRQMFRFKFLWFRTFSQLERTTVVHATDNILPNYETERKTFSRISLVIAIMQIQ